MKRILWVLLITVGTVGITFAQDRKACVTEQRDSSQWTDLSASQFKELIADTTVQLLDVRTLTEYQAGHISGSWNRDVRHPAFDKTLETLDVCRPVAVYCKSGVRSRMAARKLVDKGFRVYNLDKGFNAWPYESEK